MSEITEKFGADHLGWGYCLAPAHQQLKAAASNEVEAEGMDR